MTNIIPFIVACSLVSTAFAQAPAASAESLYQQGIAAEKVGDVAAAGIFYKDALRKDPKHANAIYSLGQLKINSATIAAKGREGKFGAVMIPIFQLDQATLQEALEAFSLTIEKQSSAKETPNFVVEDPGKKLASPRITLSLKNTPARGVLKYLLDQAGAKARYDEHAVVIIPR